MKRSLLRRVICGMIMITILLLSACSGGKGTDAYDMAEFFAMDTSMSLKIWGGEDGCERVQNRAAELDRAFSAVNEDSEIYALNRDGSAVLGKDASALVKRSLELCAELGGSFDVTVYPAVREWGFTTGGYTVPDAGRLAELAEKIDYTAVKLDGDTVTLPEGVMIDLGAVAKGYLADEARTVLEEIGAECAVLNLGGTILLYGEKPDGSSFKVGIADPDSPASYFGYLTLGEGVAATSGGYERYFERDGKRYIHILDPATAAPADNGVTSVTVFTGEGARADAMSTALFVMGKEAAAQYYLSHDGFEYVMLMSDGTLYISGGIADSFTLSDGYGFNIVKIKRDRS